MHSNSILISSCKTEKQLIEGTVLGGHRILGKKVRDVGCRSWFPLGAPEDHLPSKCSNSRSSEMGYLAF